MIKIFINQLDYKQIKKKSIYNFHIAEPLSEENLDIKWGNTDHTKSILINKPVICNRILNCYIPKGTNLITIMSEYGDSNNKIPGILYSKPLKIYSSVYSNIHAVIINNEFDIKSNMFKYTCKLFDENNQAFIPDKDVYVDVEYYLLTDLFNIPMDFLLSNKTHNTHTHINAVFKFDLSKSNIIKLDNIDTKLINDKTIKNTDTMNVFVNGCLINEQLDYIVHIKNNFVNAIEITNNKYNSNSIINILGIVF